MSLCVGDHFVCRSPTYPQNDHRHSDIYQRL